MDGKFRMSRLSLVLSPLSCSNLRVCFVVFATILLPGCEKSNSETPPPAYVGAWESEVPWPASISFNAVDTLGQPVTITTNGDMSTTLEMGQDGDLLPTFHFSTTEYPCSVDDPCNLDFFFPQEYRHQYLETGLSPDGIEAFFVRFSSTDQSQSGDGFVYVDGDRLCVSHNLWDVIDGDYQLDASEADPLAINFDSCFTKQ